MPIACCSGERLGPKLEGLLGCVHAALIECGVPVCRAFVSTSRQPPWDVCCECSSGVGQLWVSVDGIAALNNNGLIKCRPTYEANVWVGILRCALTQDDSGNPPDPGDLTQEAMNVLQDRLIINQAILCCYGESNDNDEWVLGDWQSLGPMGGCVGGRVNVTLRFADPNCP